MVSVIDEHSIGGVAPLTLTLFIFELSDEITVAIAQANDEDDKSAETALANKLKIDEIGTWMGNSKDILKKQFAGVEVEKPSVKIKKVG